MYWGISFLLLKQIGAFQQHPFIGSQFCSEKSATAWLGSLLTVASGWDQSGGLPEFLSGGSGEKSVSKMSSLWL